MHKRIESLSGSFFVAVIVCLFLVDEIYPPEFMTHSSLLVHAKPFSAFIFPFYFPYNFSIPLFLMCNCSFAFDVCVSSLCMFL